MLCYVFLIHNQILYLLTTWLLWIYCNFFSVYVDFANLHDCFNGVFADKFLFAHKDKKVKWNLVPMETC